MKRRHAVTKYRCDCGAIAEASTPAQVFTLASLGWDREGGRDICPACAANNARGNHAPGDGQGGAG